MGKLSSLDLTRSWDQETTLIADFIKKQSRSESPIRILEAGCGQKWGINLQGTPYVLTGVDLDEDALKIRMNKLKDLNEIIVGDLRTVQLNSDAFDVIFCSYVLEHVLDAESVLKNFVKWLKPGGIMILQIPDPYSVKGFVTRVTPHWFHIFYYRHIEGLKQAGEPGYAPYKTHYDVVVSRRGMRKFCQDNHLQVKAEYGTGGYRTYGRRLLGGLIRFVMSGTQLITLGRLSAAHDDLLYIVEKL
jgi:SAM-dependent methyltransferase